MRNREPELVDTNACPDDLTPEDRALFRALHSDWDSERGAYELVRDHVARKIRIIKRSMSLSNDDARDLLQEILLNVKRSPPPNCGQVRGWLNTVTRRCAVSMHKRNLRRQLVEDAQSDSSFVDPAPQAAAQETLERIAAAMDELPEDSREILIAHVIKGIPSVELAKLLGLTADNVRQKLHRARTRLKELLS